MHARRKVQSPQQTDIWSTISKCARRQEQRRIHSAHPHSDFMSKAEADQICIAGLRGIAEVEAAVDSEDQRRHSTIGGLRVTALHKCPRRAQRCFYTPVLSSVGHKVQYLDTRYANLVRDHHSMKLRQVLRRWPISQMPLLLFSESSFVIT